MSNIKADNFTWKTGETTAQLGTTVTGSQVVYGVAKSWLRYNGTAATVGASFNISSMTKNNTGDYTSNFTNSFLDSSYALTHAGGVRSEAWGIHLRNASVLPTTSAYRWWNVTPADAAQDVTHINAAFHR